MDDRWIDLTGAVNVRDLGGLPTRHGESTRYFRVIRADNLQDLTVDDVDRLVGKLGVKDVVDLRSTVEVDSEGPGPLTDHPEVTIHHHSLYREADVTDDLDASETVLPWLQEDDDAKIWNSAGLHYTLYLHRRPDSVLAALRAMASSAGAAVVHCAAGKDHTGVISALALSVAEVERDAIVADYVATGERLVAVLNRLQATTTYAIELDGDGFDRYLPRADAMHTFLDHVDTELGGPLPWLQSRGWTDADTDALRARLLAD